jgi:hypothetical protein
MKTHRFFCEKCQETIYFINDGVLGQTIMPEQLVPAKKEFPKLRVGEKAACPKCYSYLVLQRIDGEGVSFTP